MKKADIFKAAILVKQKQPLVIADIEHVGGLLYGQVKVKVVFSGICGAQLNEIDGVKGKDRFLPHLLGHEGAGIVEETGQGVGKVKAGDHVVLHWMKGEGIESATPSYLWGKRKINAGWVTTFNERAVVSENRLTKIGSGVDSKTAVLYGCALTTGYGVIHNDAKLQAGESLLVYGAGGVGCAIIMMGKLANAYPITAVDVNDFKLKAAEKSGADKVILFSKNIKDEVERIFPEGAQVTVDTTGKIQVRELAYETCHKIGRTILVGVPEKGVRMRIDSFQLHFGKKLTGSMGGSINPDIVIPRLLKLERAGRFKPDILISRTYALEKINKAINDVRSGKVIRAVVKMNSASPAD